MTTTLGHKSRTHSWFTRTVALAGTVLVVTCSGAAVGTASASAASSGHHPARPTAKLSVPKSAVVGGLVTMSMKGSKAPAHVRSMVLDFGDKTTKVSGTHLIVTKAHRYGAPGRYTVTLRLTDKVNRVAKVTRTITVRPRLVQPDPTVVHGTGALPPQQEFAPAPGLVGDAALPTSMDLTANAVPVGNQLALGSCVTWAIDYAMLGWYSRYQGIDGQPFAPMYAYSQVNLGGALAGSRPEDVLDLAKNEGEDTVAHYGANSWYDWQDKPTAADKANAAGYKIAGWTPVFAHISSFAGAAGAQAIRAQLAAGHPVAITIAVPDDKTLEAFRGAGVYNDSTGRSSSSHEILALGYNADGLLIQNSWGTGWGDQGFGRLSWAFVESSVSAADVISGLVPRQSTSDAAAPVATAPVQTMAVRTAMGASGVPVTISWSGSDNSGSVASYDLWASTNGAAWTQQTLSSDAATSITYDLTPGSHYRFAVQARDAAGNLSPWSYGSDFAVQDHAETDTAIQWSTGWTYQAWSQADGGQQATSATPKAWAQFTFTGLNVAWVTTRATNRGQANVFIDNKFVGTVDLYSSTTVSRSIAAVLNAGSAGTHSVEIDVVGTSGRADVDIDSFVVLA